MKVTRRRRPRSPFQSFKFSSEKQVNKQENRPSKQTTSEDQVWPVGHHFRNPASDKTSQTALNYLGQGAEKFAQRAGRDDPLQGHPQALASPIRLGASCLLRWCLGFSAVLFLERSKVVPTVPVRSATFGLEGR